MFYIKRVLILFGGIGTEHIVSCNSCKSILENIDKLKYDYEVVGISKENVWYKFSDDLSYLVNGNWTSANVLEIDNIINYIKKFDVVFPVMHGNYCEDGKLQGFLDLFNVKYVGCKTLSSALLMDKALTKFILKGLDIPSVPSVSFSDDYKIDDIISEIEFPMIIKPSNGGSSIGISKACNKKELIKSIKLAKKYDVLVDVHCDEIDDEQSRFLEVVAARALESGLKNKVTASHTTAMGSYNNAYTYKLFRLLKMSGINFVSNPLVNTHLQGRFDTYPKRRGITRVKELNEAGINVCFGHDDIFDPWYPMGTGNMLEVVHFGLHVCQMMGYNDINESLKFISTNSARTLNIEDEYGIEIGKPGNLILLNAESGYDAVRRRAEVLYSIREGKVIAKTIPSKSFISVNEEKEVTFKR